MSHGMVVLWRHDWLSLSVGYVADEWHRFPKAVLLMLRFVTYISFKKWPPIVGRHTHRRTAWILQSLRTLTLYTCMCVAHWVNSSFWENLDYLHYCIHKPIGHNIKTILIILCRFPLQKKFAGSPWIGVISHRCLIGLKSGEFGGHVNTE